jgi:HEAT repeat protein
MRETRDWELVLPLLDVISHPDPEFRTTVVATVNDLASFIPVEILPGYEDRLRWADCEENSWRNLTVAWVAKQEWPERVTALFSMHPNGYIREEALRKLAPSVESTDSLPFLLLRLNDWVPSIRERAKELVSKMLSKQNTRDWMPVLGLATQLQSRSRVDHRWLEDAIASMFLRPASRSSLFEAARSKSRMIASWAVDIASKLPESDYHEFMRIAFENQHPAVRLQAAKAIRDSSAFAGREQLLASMAVDRFPPIRKEALYAVLKDTPERRLQFLRRSLLDRGESMRHAARFYLKETLEPSDPSRDFRAFYLAALTQCEASHRATAIAGVGQCGTREDADRLLPFVADPSPRIASEALKAIAHLDRDRRIDWLIDLACSERGVVSISAFRALMPIAPSLPPDALRRTLQSPSNANARYNALRLLLNRNPSEAVIDAISIVGSEDETLSSLGTEYLKNMWRWAAPYKPSESYVASIRTAIANRQQPLPNDLILKFQSFLSDRSS